MADPQDQAGRHQWRASDPALSAFVDLVAEAVADEHVDDRGGEHDRDRDRGGAEQRQPPPQGHFSRSV